MVAVIGVLFFMFFIKKGIWDINADKMKTSLNTIHDNEVIDDLAQWTPFEWDTLYSFTPYTSEDEIYKVVGYRWDIISSTVNEGMNQVVFMKDDKVVCYLYGYPSDSKVFFNFGEYIGSYTKFTSDQKLSFRVNVSEEGIRNLTFSKDL